MMADLWREGEDVHVRCTDCRHVFVISPDEQVLYADFAREAARTDQRAWALPRRCLSCRKLRRERRLTVTEYNAGDWRVCHQCGVSWQLRPRDQEYFIQQVYTFPRTCYACRRA